MLSVADSPGGATAEVIAVDHPGTAIPTTPPPSPSPTIRPPATANPSAGGSSVDLGLVWACIGVAVAIAVLAVVVFFIVHSTRARMDRNRATRAAISARWDVAAKTLNEVSDSYSAYLASPVDVHGVHGPLLDDVDEPLTATFLNAYSEARAAAYDSRPADLEAADRAARTAEDALTAWKRASSHARGRPGNRSRPVQEALTSSSPIRPGTRPIDQRRSPRQHLAARANAARRSWRHSLPEHLEIAYNAVTRSLTTVEKKQLTMS